MQLKLIYRNYRHALKILRTEGLLSLIIILLTSLQKRLRQSGSKHKMNVDTIARYSDLIEFDPHHPPVQKRSKKSKALTVNWLMPPPGKGSGGHMTLFRFIKYLEDAGHSANIYLHTRGGHGPIEDVERLMGTSFPKLKARMQWLEPGVEMSASDALFATSWETAYSVFNSKSTAKRYYFVQDFEPYFYPVGSHYSLAENTYRMGFFGITAGGWLASKLRDYGMQTDNFDFGADKSIYKFENDGKRKEIMVYVRPYTARRGFEVAIVALDLFHRRHPEYKINFFGYDVAEYNIPFPYENLKTLEVTELNELYNRCAAGLVLSYTNMSLLPLELLACGTIPVVNDGPNNRLVSDNPYIEYSANDPHALAEALSKVVSRRDATKHAAKAAGSVTDNDWDASGAKFVSIIESTITKK